MMFLMRWLGSLRMVHLWCAHFQARKLADPLYMSIFLVSVPALLLAMYCITWMYRSFSKHQQLAWLVPWLFIYAAQSTYVVRYTQSWMYPYDFLSLACFAAGICLIRKRSLFLFSVIFILSTLNRETTVFLLPVLLAEYLYEQNGQRNPLRKLFVPSVVGAFLFLAWLALRLSIREHFPTTQNEEYIHWIANLAFLKHLQDWPEMAGTCGFLLFVPVVFAKRIKDRTLQVYLLALLPLWLLVMLLYGMVTEARIYGELLVLLIPTAIIVFEEWLIPDGRRPAAAPR